MVTMENEYKNGDVLTIWITGMIGEYKAEVVRAEGSEGHPGPWLKVLGDQTWPALKPGDYIIRQPR